MRSHETTASCRYLLSPDRMHRRKKIAVLVNSVAAGGAERIVANLLFTLQQDYNVHLLLLRNEIDYPMPQGQRVEFLSSEKDGGSEAGSNMIRLPFVAWRLRQYCNKNNIDLLISFLTRPNFAAGLAKKFGLDAAVIMSERVYTPLFYDPSTVRGKIGGKLVSLLYPYADAIAPNSEGTKNALIDVYGVKNQYFLALNQIPVHDIRRISNESVDDVDFHRFTFVCVAGFREQKNHLLLIDALKLLEDKDVQLLLIGKGPTFDAVHSRVVTLGLTDKVIFLGQTENPHKYVAKSQCFILSSDYEGFPNVILEALACGTPVISTDCLTGPREIVAPTKEDPIPAGTVFYGEYGVLVPVSDVKALAAAMDEMMNDPALLDQYGQAGAKRVQDFDGDNNPDPFKHAIEKVLVGHSL